MDKKNRTMSCFSFSQNADSPTETPFSVGLQPTSIISGFGVIPPKIKKHRILFFKGFKYEVRMKATIVLLLKKNLLLQQNLLPCLVELKKKKSSAK